MLARLVIAAVLTGAPVAFASPLYLVTGLGLLDGLSTFGHAINDSGQVVGNVSNGRPFLYTPGTGLSYLDFSPGEANAAGVAINNRGQVAGYSDGRGFLYTPGAGFVDIGNLGGTGGTNALGINDLGQVTGVSQTTAGPGNSTFRAFLYSQATGIQDLGSLGANSVGNAVNNLGQVTGYYVPTGTTYQHAFLYTPGQGMVDLTPDAQYAAGYAINDAGQVTGNSDYDVFVYTPGKGTQYIPFGVGYGINDAGEAVGRSSDTRLGFAFSYNQGDPDLTNLNGFIDPSFKLLIQQAQAVNASGQILTNGFENGAGTFGFPSSTFILTPNPAAVPEPASAALLISGGLAFYTCRKLRRKAALH